MMTPGTARVSIVRHAQTLAPAQRPSTQADEVIDHVIDEQPVALVFNGLSHVVMMATPTHLEDLGVGFALSEGLIPDLGALRDVEVERHAQGLSVHLEVSSQAFAALKQRRRQLAGRTGCGLCGIDSLQAFRADWPVPLPGLARRGGGVGAHGPGRRAGAGQWSAALWLLPGPAGGGLHLSRFWCVRYVVARR